MKRNAFSLLEVVLAIAIFAGAMVVLGQLVSLGMRSSASTQEMTNAQLMAESIMAETLAGAIEMAAVSNVPIELAPDWNYTIAMLPTEEEYLLSLEVTVSRETARGPVGFTLTRWVRDPSLAAADDAEATTQ